MGINVLSGINNFYEYGFSNSILSKLFGNQFCLAAFISIFIIFMLLIFYPFKDTVTYGFVFKLLLYLFLFTLLFINIHDGINKISYEKTVESKKAASLVNNIVSSYSNKDMNAVEGKGEANKKPDDIEIKPSINLYKLSEISIE
jgi:hypothetical protein